MSFCLVGLNRLQPLAFPRTELIRDPKTEGLWSFLLQFLYKGGQCCRYGRGEGHHSSPFRCFSRMTLSISSVVVARVYVGFQPHSSRAHESSILFGQESAILCLMGSTLYSTERSGICFLIAAVIISGLKLMAVTLKELRCFNLAGSASI